MNIIWDFQLLYLNVRTTNETISFLCYLIYSYSSKFLDVSACEIVHCNFSRLYILRLYLLTTLCLSKYLCRCIGSQWRAITPGKQRTQRLQPRTWFTTFHLQLLFDELKSKKRCDFDVARLRPPVFNFALLCLFVGSHKPQLVGAQCSQQFT